MLRRLIAVAVLTGAALAGAGAPAALAAPAVVSDLAYGTDPAKKLDAYPANVAGSPTVVVVHGGSWKGGDKATPRLADVALSLQADGFAVFSINYRLVTASRDGVPMQANDVRAAVRWVVANGGRYGADVANLTLLGSSAGAHLAALAGQQIVVAGRVDRIAAFSGPMDFAGAEPADLSPGSYANVSNYLGCDLASCTDPELTEPSPLHNITATSPPFLIVNSTDELVPLDQATSMHDALLAAGVESTLRVFEGGQHAFGLFDEMRAELGVFMRG